MVRIHVNGEEQEITAPITLAELMQINKVVQPDMLSIQLNGEFVDRNVYGTTEIKDGDEIDFLYFMGGGR
ncbi:MAG: sulfur carrier protein ThiS [Tannerellaceae bacterium]|jgi:sulfur carrier protein|nr:sulfur carrier protein ThiS [Tannerellaceae bacterium]